MNINLIRRWCHYHQDRMSCMLTGNDHNWMFSVGSGILWCTFVSKHMGCNSFYLQDGFVLTVNYIKTATVRFHSVLQYNIAIPMVISQNQTLLLLLLLLSSSSSSSCYWLFCTAVETADVMHSCCQIICGKMIVSDGLAEVREEMSCFLRNCSKIYMKGLTKHVKTIKHSWDLNWVPPERKSIFLLVCFVCVFGVGSL
jgi:hypothetical protein